MVALMRGSICMGRAYNRIDQKDCGSLCVIVDEVLGRLLGELSCYVLRHPLPVPGCIVKKGLIRMVHFCHNCCYYVTIPLLPPHQYLYSPTVAPLVASVELY